MVPEPVLMNQALSITCFEAIVRHSDVKTLQVYADTNLAATPEALDKLDEWLS
jgi:hypothetical protein